ncbi:MAG: hypothetical protein LBR34_07110 [Prevotella sp.]|jgi:hypothetical protein|nr:hypothetical protein [Prevotella sp.]
METKTLANTTLLRDKPMQTAEYLEQFPSVARVIWIDQTSSSGSWSGIIVEKASDNTYDLLEFFQEYEDDGIRIYIGNPVTEKSVSEEQIEATVSEYVDSLYFSADDLFENETIKNIAPAKKKKNNVVSLEIPFE